jgi:iron complex outermembrane receptor protein
MKKYFLFLLVLGLFLNSNAAINSSSSLRGFVKEQKTNNPLQNASVYIVDLKLGVLTDTNGFYKFRNIPNGTFLVEVKYEGYKTISKSIKFNNNEVEENFTLEPSIKEMSEVVVTGTSKAVQIKRNPVPIVLINHDYMMTNINDNAIDAIAKIPGIRAVTTGPNVSKPFIRGLGYNRILTLYDGIRQEGQQWGDEHGIEIDQYAVNRVEVIKGPASLSYGSDALAGVVNLIPTQPAPEGKKIGDFVSDYHTNNGMIGNSLLLGATKNGIEWMARVSHKQAYDYQNKVDGRVYGTAFNETDANASLGIHHKWGYSHLGLVLFDDIQEIPSGNRDSATWKFTRTIDEAGNTEIVSDADLKSYKIEPIHQHIQHYRVFSNNNFVLNDGSSILMNLGFQRSVRREYSHPEDLLIPGLYLQLNTFNYDLKYALRDINDWNIVFGVNGMFQQNNSNGGTEFIIPSYKQFDFGSFITAKKSYGKLDIAGGLRNDIRSFNNDELYVKPNPTTGFDMPVFGTNIVGADKPFSSYSHTFNGLSGSLGATYNFTERFSAKANISRGFRAPNIAEISANGVHPGTNFYQIGNSNFNPELSLQEDIGMVYAAPQITFELNLFNNRINNYIYNQKLIGENGQDSVIQGSGVDQTFKFQSSKANLWGGELSIDLHPNKQLHFENTLSVVYAQNLGNGIKQVADTEKYLPFIPPLHGSTEIRLDWDSKILGIKHGFIKAQMEYYSNQNRIFSAYGTETSTPGYTLFNLGTGGSFVDRNKKTICTLY